MKESKQEKLARIHEEYALLCKEIPDPKCALNFSNPFELLIATVLSAQTTDKRVNSVTPELFDTFQIRIRFLKLQLSKSNLLLNLLDFIE